MSQIIRRDFTARPDEAEAALARLIRAQLMTGMEARGRASLVLSGGRTPSRIMPLVADMDIDWDKVFITLTDERWTSLDDPASTQGALQQMMAGTPMEKAQFFGLYHGDMTLEEAPQKLSPAFHRVFPDPFDVIFLGMGEDGHTASLFPSRAWGNACEQDGLPLVADLSPPVLPQRISLCPSALLNARAIGMIVAGTAKQDMLQQALAGRNEAKLPIAVLGRDCQASIELFMV